MRNRGLTLIEVIVSVAIVTVGLLLLQVSITDNLERADRSVKQRAATTLARQKLEDYLSQGSGGGTEGTFEEEGFPNYRWQIVQEEVTIGETGSMQRIKITVNFNGDSDNDNGSQNQNNNYTLVTFAESETDE
jgi:prepilin-type N-terminal cleavage/methylation domain-containing protein